MKAWGKMLAMRARDYLAKKSAKKKMQQDRGPHRYHFLAVFKKYVAVLIGIGAAYLALLSLLVLVERNSPDATIHSIGEAVWYSLATFTTVGYGDFYPVTPAGRGIASIFLVAGIGLLGFFVGFMMEFLSRARPAAILSLNSGKPWYIFTGRSPYAEIFAENLKAVRPDAMIIYSSTKEERVASKHICVPWTPAELLDRRGFLFDAHIICMKDNEMENFLDAVELSDMEVPVICLASFTPARHPMNISFFSLVDATARMFWQQYPVREKAETILMIGFGSAGTVLLDRALQLNVFSEEQSINYHVFGDASEYLRNRKQLSRIVSINDGPGTGDRVHFHEDLWNSDEALLTSADRLILCADDERDNIAILHTIQKFFAVRGDIYIYNSNVRGIATPFGQTRDVLTPAFVLHNRLTDMAMCRHALFRHVMGGNMPIWEDLGSLDKDMSYTATDHISIKAWIALGDDAPAKPFDELEPELLRKAAAVYDNAPREEKERLRAIEHMRALRAYLLHNYRYGADIDDEKRTNPLVRPYKELEDAQKAVADTAWALLGELAAHKEAKRL